MSETKVSTNLTEGKLAPALLAFSVPFLLSTLLQTLYGTVDTLTVGNFATTGSVSAVATGAEVLSIFTFLAYGLSNGSTILLGQSIGAKDHKRAAKLVGNTIIDFAVISVVFMLLLLFLYPTALDLLNIPEEAKAEAYRYCKICSFGIPLIVGYNTVGAMLRAMGDSKSPLLFVSIACVINVFGDLFLTGVMGMGAAGVAIATVCAQGVSFIFSLIFIMKRGLGFEFHVSDIRYDGHTTAQIFKVGVPMGLQSILINLSFLFITSIINAMGVTASAAMGIGDKIVNFAFLPQNSIGAALAVVVAQNIGAKKADRAISAVKLGIMFCVPIETVFLLFCQFLPDVLPSLFSNDAEVIHMAGMYMRAYSIDAVLTSLTFCLSGLLNGCGKTTQNMVQNLISTFLGRVPATYLLSRLPNTNLFLIGMAAPASTIMSVIMLGVYIGLGYWKKGLSET
ncbi:MAG: MATE family efflux transporter [Lachnospiraceae bacterium]|nr:MATE family efflux transporter [Lachnospiraceae bacterium]